MGVRSQPSIRPIGASLWNGMLFVPTEKLASDNLSNVDVIVSIVAFGLPLIIFLKHGTDLAIE